MHLAKLMHRTVDELLDTMSYPEILRWQEYFQLFPEDSWRADVRSAQICAILANVHRDPKQHQKPFEIGDFMLFDKARTKAKEAAKAEQAQGAKIAPETVAWLFSKARKTVRGEQ